MLCVTWLVVVDRAKPAAAYAARCAHGLKSGPVLTSQVAILVSWVIHSYVCRKAGSMSLSASPGDRVIVRKEDQINDLDTLQQYLYITRFIKLCLLLQLAEVSRYSFDDAPNDLFHRTLAVMCSPHVLVWTCMPVAAAVVPESLPDHFNLLIRQSFYGHLHGHDLPFHAVVFVICRETYTSVCCRIWIRCPRSVASLLRVAGRRFVYGVQNSSLCFLIPQQAERRSLPRIRRDFITAHLSPRYL